MIMKLNHFKNIRCSIAAFALIAVVLGACSKMDSTYKDFIKGSIVYIGSADSVKIYPGKNRLQLSWISFDPAATEAKIYWNNKSDSLSVPLHITGEADTINVMLNDLPEGSYSFDIYLYDDKGNTSIKTSAVGQVYGDSYIGSLLSRPVKSALFDNGTVNISWGTADETVIGTQLTYEDADNKVHVIDVPVDSLFTTLENFDFSVRDTFRYRTLYVPDSMSIDTFYSAYETVKVTGPPVEYDRSDWTAPAEDYDVPSGRVPQNTLDNKTSTVWHMDKTHGYPHHITIDMHAENTVNGFTFIQRTPLDGAAQLIEIEISSDNQNWESLGAFTLENSGDKQFLELLEPISLRYFRITFKSDYKNGSFTAIAEIGAYKR